MEEKGMWQNAHLIFFQARMTWMNTVLRDRLSKPCSSASSVPENIIIMDR